MPDPNPLTPEEWQRVRPHLTELIRLPTPERQAALLREFAEDGALLEKIREILSIIEDQEPPSDRRWTPTPDPPISVHSLPVLPRGGDRIAHFIIVRPLGSGGMGDVYLAEDSILRRLVALKLLRAPAAANETRARLLLEARAAAALRHPAIVVVHQVVEERDRLILAMEYVEGVSLAEKLGGGALPVVEALRVARAVAEALAYAHDRGVVHCDIKPANVLIDLEGQPRLLDFGLAHTKGALLDGGLGQMAQLYGTTPYVAPERLLKKTSSATCDVYSLGVTLFELLTGRLPFVAADDAGLFLEILASPAPVPSAFRNQVPAEVDAVVAKCLAKAPGLRFQSARDLADEIQAVLDQTQRVQETKRQDSQGQTRQPSAEGNWKDWLGLLGASFLAVVFATMWAGLLSTRVYEVALVGADGPSSSPAEWAEQGLRSLFIPALVAGALSVAVAVVATVFHFVGGRLASRLTSRIASISSSSSSRQMAQTLVLAQIISVGLFLWYFGSVLVLIRKLPESASAMEVAALDDVRLYLYRIVASAIVYAMSIWWAALGRRAWLRRESPGVTNVLAGTALWCVGVSLWAAPYRLTRDYDAVQLDGAACFVVAEMAGQATLFCPDAPAGQRRRRQSAQELPVRTLRQKIFQREDPSITNAP